MFGNDKPAASLSIQQAWCVVALCHNQATQARLEMTEKNHSLQKHAFSVMARICCSASCVGQCWCSMLLFWHYQATA
jgi:hypothetical protein